MDRKLLGLNGFIALCGLLLSCAAHAEKKPVLADAELLRGAGIKALATENSTGVAYAVIDQLEEERLSQLAHAQGRCGGFEALPISSKLEPRHPVITHVFGQLAEQEAKNRRFRVSTQHFRTVTVNPAIEAALTDVSEENLRNTVTFLSGFRTRLHNGSDPNRHVEAVKERLNNMLSGSGVPYELDLISHTSTPQKSIRVRLQGSARPSEVIVLGGHLDSINQDWFGSKDAPGADDNASGSANLIEALRVLLKNGRPQRTVEFFWYAGEEGGLLGSAEIAKDYKRQGKDVVAVLQLDMTMFPGDGEFVLGSMNDFTSAWLRSYLATLNGIYIKAKIIDDKCGYGCSDHASWFRQGYPTIMPFEASFRGANNSIHTAKDVIDGRSSFRHSAMFSRIALAIAMDLGNSTLREPK